MSFYSDSSYIFEKESVFTFLYKIVLPDTGLYEL